MCMNKIFKQAKYKPCKTFVLCTDFSDFSLNLDKHLKRCHGADERVGYSERDST